ncbi:MAG: hypothetical protein ACM3KM_01845 [Acidobacteriaceae bacterium]
MAKLITHNVCASLLPYQWRKNRFPNFARSLFFLSFADAFRALINSLDVSTRVILVPDFYCPDTLLLFKEFGDLRFYKTNPDLTINIDSYLESVKSLNPGLIVNYGFLGSPINDSRIRTLLQGLPETIIIEDCAHRILTEQDIAFVHNRHFYIDSIRKQTSILGSHLIFSADLPLPYPDGKFSAYKIRSLLVRAEQETVNMSAYLLQSQFLYLKSEALFDKLDAIIGTSKQPAEGGSLSKFQWSHLNLKKIKAHKASLVDAYLRGLSGIKFEGLKLPPVSDKCLTYFPCLVSSVFVDRLIDYLETKQIWVSTLWDEPVVFSGELNKELLRSVVVLPLTQETSVEDVGRICLEMKNFFSSITANS